ncbi:MAG: hypothetical protein Q9171_001310 [Xanthocarpia ochracea]
MPNARGFQEEVFAAYPSIARPLPGADPLRLLPFEVSVERTRIVHRPSAIEVSGRLDEVNTVKTDEICAHQILEPMDPDIKSNVKSHVAVTLTRSQKRNARLNQHHKRKTQEEIAKEEIEAGILKEDIQTTKRFRSDLDGNLSPVKKARSSPNATENDDLNTRAITPEPSLSPDQNAAVDVVEKCKAYERVIARQGHMQAGSRSGHWTTSSRTRRSR